MKHELAVASLWAIAIAVTVVTVKQEGVFTVLGPVYAICMIGSIVTVRIAHSNAGHAAA
jgi:hypothetical protein